MVKRTELTSVRPMLPEPEQGGGVSEVYPPPEPPPRQRWRQIAHNASKHRPWFSFASGSFGGVFGIRLFLGGVFGDRLSEATIGRSKRLHLFTFPTWLGEPPTPHFAPPRCSGGLLFSPEVPPT